MSKNNNNINQQSKVSCYEKERIVDYQKYQQFLNQNICPYCQKISADIGQCQLGCQKLFGQRCFENDVKSNQCPRCQITLKKPKKDYENRFLSQMVSQQIQIKCINEKYGCETILEFNSNKIQAHESKCTFTKKFCTNVINGCPWVGGPVQLQEHLQICQFQLKSCEYCKKLQENDFKYVVQNKHNEKCVGQVLNNFKEIVNNMNNYQNQDLQQYVRSQSNNLLELIKQFENIIENKNRTINQIINYTIQIEQKEENKKDKLILLEDIKNGVLNFNSLDNLFQLTQNLDQSIIKSFKLNDVNLSNYISSFQSKDDYSDLIQLIEQKANQDNDQISQYTLGRLFYYGDKNIPLDYNQSYKYAKKSSDQNYHQGLQLLGDLFYDNLIPCENPLKEAFNLYEKSALLGNAEALNSLGQMYDEGENVQSNQEIALKYFKDSASLGDYGGLFNLGIYYQEGYGGEKRNLKKSFQCYKKCAHKGDTDAMEKLIEMYKSGLGVEKNQIKQYKWQGKFLKMVQKFQNQSISISNLSTNSSKNTSANSL